MGARQLAICRCVASTRELLLSITSVGRSYRFIRRLSDGRFPCVGADNAPILMERMLKGRIEPGVRSFDLKPPLAELAEG